MFEIGQEWDNLALLPGRGGAKQDDYNMTVYNHLLAELTGMSAGVRTAAAFTTTDGAQVQIGVNTGGWIHFKFLQMLVADKLDFDIVAYGNTFRCPAGNHFHAVHRVFVGPRFHTRVHVFSVFTDAHHVNVLPGCVSFRLIRDTKRRYSFFLSFFLKECWEKQGD